MGVVATHADSSVNMANTSADLKSTGEEAVWDSMIGPIEKF
jgi:hypothetical protein